jgi:spore germination protein PB
MIKTKLINQWLATCKGGCRLNIYIHQTIIINQLKTGGIVNSSVFQIGTTGNINAKTITNNTGDYLEAAPPLTEPGQIVHTSQQT